MKRYDIKTFATEHTLGIGLEIKETENGAWVRYDDFKAIENSLAALMKQFGLSSITGCHEKKENKNHE